MPDSRSPQPINPSWERVQLARHPKRPHSLDYIQRLFTDFHELHGDRAFADDHAIVAGMAWFEGRPVMIIGQQKGRDTKQKVLRNWGMPRPEGYRKAMRLMELAAKFSRPIVTLLDTPGAYPGKDAQAAAALKMTAPDLKELGLIDGIVPEPAPGAHSDPDQAAEALRVVLRQSLAELSVLSPQQLIDERYEKFRRMGSFFSEPAATQTRTGDAPK